MNVPCSLHTLKQCCWAQAEQVQDHAPATELVALVIERHDYLCLTETASAPSDGDFQRPNQQFLAAEQFTHLYLPNIEKATAELLQKSEQSHSNTVDGIARKPVQQQCKQSLQIHRQQQQDNVNQQYYIHQPNMLLLISNYLLITHSSDVYFVHISDQLVCHYVKNHIQSDQVFVYTTTIWD